MTDKQLLARHFDDVAPLRSRWFWRNYTYHAQIIRACHPFLNPGSRVLELGCSTGELLHELRPSQGVGVDISPVSIEYARRQYPNLHWVCADVENLPDTLPLDQPFDVIVMADLVGYLDDIQLTLEHIRRLTHPNTRIIIATWNWIWQPALRLGELLRLKTPDLEIRQNWVSPTVIRTILMLAGYTPLQTLPGVLLPFDIAGLSPLINTFSHAPIVERCTLLRTVIARPTEPNPEPEPTSVTVVIPTRNEVGNIESIIARTPDMGTHTELLFIDGNSTDGTVEKIREQIQAHPERDIKFMPQVPPQSPDADTPPNLMLKLGKGDAVRKAFAAASGDILMILDSDITVPPEELPKFYDALVANKADFVNGTRLVYPQETGAMRPINKLGNVVFSLLFSWLLSQPITDTLCGTKALRKRDYDAIAANRSYFGDFDPFGDFDLLFGAAWLGYRIIDLPVHYRARTYGDSKVRVDLHGPLLGRMSAIAFWQFKVRPWLIGRRQAYRKPQHPTAARETSERSKLVVRAGVLLGVVWIVVHVVRWLRH
ncbi:MAG: glycosyltransferase [Chloroflexi bacterium]|nr:glycosyltransferase [Chloroflexota bacterium]